MPAHEDALMAAMKPSDEIVSESADAAQSPEVDRLLVVVNASDGQHHIFTTLSTFKTHSRRTCVSDETSLYPRVYIDLHPLKAVKVFLSFLRDGLIHTRNSADPLSANLSANPAYDPEWNLFRLCWRLGRDQWYGIDSPSFRDAIVDATLHKIEQDCCFPPEYLHRSIQTWPHPNRTTGFQKLLIDLIFLITLQSTEREFSFDTNLQAFLDRSHNGQSISKVWSSCVYHEHNLHDFLEYPCYETSHVSSHPKPTPVQEHFPLEHRQPDQSWAEATSTLRPPRASVSPSLLASPSAPCRIDFGPPPLPPPTCPLPALPKQKSFYEVRSVRTASFSTVRPASPDDICDGVTEMDSPLMVTQRSSVQSTRTFEGESSCVTNPSTDTLEEVIGLWMTIPEHNWPGEESECHGGAEQTE